MWVKPQGLQQPPAGPARPRQVLLGQVLPASQRSCPGPVSRAGCASFGSHGVGLPGKAASTLRGEEASQTPVPMSA